LTDAIIDSIHEGMAQLVVRQLDETIVQELRERAARAGVSMEEEHRRILRQALQGSHKARDFKEHLLSIPGGGEDQILERLRPANRRRLKF
jgi:plasmid stability protein